MLRHMGMLRNLRWGGTAALLLFSSPVLAEVCDKVDEAWDASEGARTFGGEIIASAPFPLGVMGMIAILWLFRLRWLLLASAGVGAALFVAISYYVWFDDQIVMDAAVREGCVHPNYALIASVLYLAPFLLSVAAYLHIYKRTNTL
jgi:hypothetical protein